ncbi:MAG: hypothetical protein JO247_19390 [Chloroflexi bacterium]|nr:hypothetical protein [Chloroflexota bacterium]
MTFDQALAGWHDFYMLAGTAGATLLGLLFVAVSLKLDVVKHETAKHIRALAWQTFASFLSVLFVSFTFLIPFVNQPSLGLALAIFGLIGIVRMAISAPSAVSAGWSFAAGGRFGLPLAAYCVLLACGIDLVEGSLSGLYWMVAPILMLLASAAQGAWSLLLGVRGIELSEQALAHL